MPNKKEVEQKAMAQVKLKDEEVIKGILKDAGVENYDRGVVNQLLNVVYNSAAGVLLKAKQNAETKLSTTIEVDDIKLAITEEASKECQPPSQKTLQEIADKCNAKPLPIINAKSALRLPPFSDCLLAQNFQMVKPQPMNVGLDHGLKALQLSVKPTNKLAKQTCNAKAKAKPPNMGKILPAGSKIAVKKPDMAIAKPIAKAQALPAAQKIVAKPPNMTPNLLPAGSEIAVKKPKMKPNKTHEKPITKAQADRR